MPTIEPIVVEYILGLFNAEKIITNEQMNKMIERMYQDRNKWQKEINENIRRSAIMPINKNRDWPSLTPDHRRF